MKSPTVYMMSNKKDGVLYIGVTSHLERRIYEHKMNYNQGFTTKYNVKHLVWYERHNTMENAITREKKMKKWKRHLKTSLIENMNPEWKDLYATLA